MLNEHISIGICTYCRPTFLKRLLYKINIQNTHNLFDFSIIVVDNDYLKSGKEVIDEFMKESTNKIIYRNVPEQNISLARNEVIKNVNGNYIALIDDDEYPEIDWLFNLYNALNKYSADGILGPVLPHFDQNPPNWVLKGDFFTRISFPSGQILSWQYTRTGNALLKSSIFKKDEEWFNPKFGSGGEDRDFFKRKICEGFKFIWCNEAQVFETIPPHRWNQSVLLKRALLRGKVASQKSTNKAKEVLLSLIAIFIYSLSLPALLVLGYHNFFKYLIKICDHLGKLLTMFGFDIIKEKYIS